MFKFISNFFLVLLCFNLIITFLEVSLADDTTTTTTDVDKNAAVKLSYSESDGFGHFKYGHDISNGIQAHAEGNGHVIRGEYYYIDEKGDKIKVTYIADTTGFHPIIGAPSK